MELPVGIYRRGSGSPRAFFGFGADSYQVALIKVIFEEEWWAVPTLHFFPGARLAVPATEVKVHKTDFHGKACDYHQITCLVAFWYHLIPQEVVAQPTCAMQEQPEAAMPHFLSIDRQPV